MGCAETSPVRATALAGTTVMLSGFSLATAASRADATWTADCRGPSIYGNVHSQFTHWDTIGGSYYTNVPSQDPNIPSKITPYTITVVSTNVSPPYSSSMGFKKGTKTYETVHPWFTFDHLKAGTYHVTMSGPSPCHTGVKDITLSAK